MKGRKYIILMSIMGLLLASILGYVLYKRIKEPVVIELGIFAGSMYDVPNWQSYKAFDEEIQKFEKENPDIKVVYRSGTLKQDYSEWLSQRVIRGKTPDVFCILPGDFNTFASIGVLKELDPYIEQEKIKLDKLYGNAIKSGQFQSKQYALPRELDPKLMFVNKTLLTKEGIAVPKGNWTWDDFYDICSRVTKDLDGDGKLDQFGQVGFDWKNAVFTNGQHLFDDKGTKAMFYEEGVLEALQYVQNLNELNENFKVTTEDFDQGNVAFKPFPFSAYRAYKTYPYRIIKYAEFDWAGIKLPRGPKGNNASELNSFLFGVSSRTQHEKAALKFLNFLIYNRSSQMDVFTYSHGVPVRQDITESKEADIELAKYNPEKEISVDKKILSSVIEQSIVTPKFHKYEEAMDMADKEIFQMLNEEKDIENTLLKLQQQLNEFLRH